MARTRDLKVNISGDPSDLNRAFNKVARDTDQLASKFRGLNGTLGDFNRGMTATRNSVQLIKFPALIAGAGAAAQAVGALGAAGVAAGSALAPLAGTVPALGVAYTAMGQAALVAKAATMGLEEAIKGQKGAMDKLSPVQRDFVKQIRALKEETQGLRGTAQRGLLGGLTEGLHQVVPMFAAFRPIVRDTATVMGDLAARAGALVRSWRGDLLTVGRANVTIIANIGTAALSAANAARNLIAAATPLAKWFSELAVRGAKWISVQVQSARETGKLAGFFVQTAGVARQLITIGQNLAAAFFQIGKGAAPLGRELLQSFTLLTAKFREWAESTRGQNQIRAYFEAARGPVFALLGLVGDLGAAFLRLSRPTQLTTGLVGQLRTLVPVLESVVSSTTAGLGPALVPAIGNVARLAAVFAGSSGPLTLYVKLIGTLAGAFATLLQSSPGLSSMVVTLVGFRSVLAAVTVLGKPFVATIRAMGAAYAFMTGNALRARLATAAVTAAMALQRAAMVASAAATRVMTGAQVALNVALRANPIGLVITALTALGVGLVLAYRKSQTFREIVNGAFGAVKSEAHAVASVVSALATGAFGLVKSAADKVSSAVRAIASAFNSVKSAVGGIGGALKGAAGALNPFGDGLGQQPGGLPSIPNLTHVGAGNLMGAQPALAPVASIGSRFGLSVSSGRRPGSITTSGNISYHSSGEALDMSNGVNTPQERSFQKFMHDRFGGRLAELIGPVTSLNLKNGSPFPYSAAIQAQHKNHVHVAIDTGRPGVGDGIGDVTRLARGAGFRGSDLVTAIAIAGAESGFRSHASNRNTNGSIDRGYWQINSVHGAMSTFDPEGSARAAYSLFRRRGGFGDWVTYNTGAYRAYLSQARAAAVGSRSSSGSSGSHPDGPTAGEINAHISHNKDRIDALRQELRHLPPGKKSAARRVAIQDQIAHLNQQNRHLTAQKKGLPSGGISDAEREHNQRIAAQHEADAAVTPYETAIALSDVQLAQAEGTKSTADDLQAKIARRSIVTARIKTIRAALKKRTLRPTTRLRLTQELAQLTGEHSQLQTDISGLRHPAAADTGGAGGGEADPNQPLIDAINAKAEQDRQLAEEQAARDEEIRRAQEEHTAALNAVKDEVKRQTDFANTVQNTSAFQMTKSLTDILSGAIVGYGVAGRAFTPGTGVEYSY